MLNKYTYIGVSQSEEPIVWGTEVQKAVGEFATGPIAGGLSSVVTNVIARMLGSAAGKRQVEQK